MSTIVNTNQRERLELGGVLIDHVDNEGAVKRLAGFLHTGKTQQVVTVNLDFLSIAQRDPRFRRTLNTADLAVADGMPLVWASRWRGMPLQERVAGVDLVHDSCRLAAIDGRGVFLMGAAPGVAEAAGRKLQELYPGLRIAGTYSPPIGTLSRRESARIVRMINAAKPAFLFVALGAPRQDLWISENRAQLNVPVCMGVGCVFDVVAGTVVRAPQWMQRGGLEWAYRLSQEPSRLWRRYLLNDSRMLFRLWFESASAKRAETPLAVPTT
jgi:N-acetylglucosaminyldiphosphoundecaprenol N-acetyl-beta-D-mannosaminyltransferase